MLEFILFCITLTLKQKKPDLKCVFGLCVCKKQKDWPDGLLVLGTRYAGRMTTKIASTLKYQDKYA